MVCWEMAALRVENFARGPCLNAITTFYVRRPRQLRDWCGLAEESNVKCNVCLFIFFVNDENTDRNMLICIVRAAQVRQSYIHFRRLWENLDHNAELTWKPFLH